MLLASCGIPLPTEIIMPFSGFLVGSGKFSMLGVGLAGTAGSLIGSLLLYYFGYYGGRALVVRYGKYMLFSEADLEKTEKFFKQYGDSANLIVRLLPIARTFISFPAGLAKMEIKRFTLYALLGSAIWSFGLAFVGKILGEHWTSLNQSFHNFNIFLGAAVVAWVIWYFYRRFAKAAK